MWLLDIFTRQLELFDEVDIPRYAILSHRWEDEEITFEDIQVGGEAVTLLKGYRKVDLCCKQVAKFPEDDKSTEEPLSYVWIDTCCIDRTNSAELSEAINSMWRWYQNSTVCYAYLVDVTSRTSDGEDLARSEWFQRGWTLQELLAPRSVEFFNHDWRWIGSRTTLADKVAQITSIDTFAMKYFHRKDYNTATKLSWAANRKTTRIEDRAYSLLGMFGVYMPLIYGEGERAFFRLQEAILETNQDFTIFAWTRAYGGQATVDDLSVAIRHDSTTSIFASSPSWFQSPGLTTDIIKYTIENADVTDEEVTSGTSFSGNGLSLSIPLIPVFPTYFIAPICVFQDLKGNTPQFRKMGMLLSRAPSGLFRRYIGIDGSSLIDATTIPGCWQARACNIVLQRASLGLTTYLPHHLGASKTTEMYGFNVSISAGLHDWTYFTKHEATSSIHLPIPFGHSGLAGVLRQWDGKTVPTFLLLGYLHNFSPFCLIICPTRCTDTEWHPSKTFLTIPAFDVQDFVIGSSEDMLSLVDMLNLRNYAARLGKDGVELKVMQWRKQYARFAVTQHFDLEVNRGDKVTIVTISAGHHQDRASNSSGRVDSWNEAHKSKHA